MTKAISHFWEEPAASAQRGYQQWTHKERENPRGPPPKAYPWSLGDISSGVYLKVSFLYAVALKLPPALHSHVDTRQEPVLGGEGVLQQMGQ